MRNLRVVSSGLLCLLIVALAGIGELQGAEAERLNPPAQRPVVVTVDVEMTEVSEIKDEEERIEAEFYVFCRWNDPRLKFDAAAEGKSKKSMPVAEIWTPGLAVADDIKLTSVGGKYAHVESNGDVMQRLYFRATVATDFDLHSFPFDRHELLIAVRPADFESDAVVLKAGDAAFKGDGRPVPEGWNFLGIHSHVKDHKFLRLDLVYSRLELTIVIARDPNYYFWTIVLPLLPILVTAWAVFWMQREEFHSQIDVAVTAMLTVVAYRICIDDTLPPLDYMTRMDFFLLLCQLFVFGSFILCIVMHVCDSVNRSDFADTINRRCRWIPPVLMFGTLALLVFLPPSIVMWIVLAFFAAWIILSRPSPRAVRDWALLILDPEKTRAARGGLGHTANE